ncbi:MAG: HDIG domain-containing protein [Symbiobacteriaceae bacterium]|nr:HDIG domain-containing protein [Symbiobacteriaceae bacterium]
MDRAPIELPKLEEELSLIDEPALPWLSGRCFLLLLLFWFLSVVLIIPTVLPHYINAEIGQPITQDVIAPRSVIDRYETEQRQKRARDGVAAVFHHDQSVGLRVEERLNSFLQGVSNAHSLYADSAMRIIQIERIIPAEWTLSKLAIELLADTDATGLEVLQSNLLEVLRERYADDIEQSNYNTHRFLAQDRLVSLITGDDELFFIARELLDQLIEINFLVDEKATEDAKSEAAAAVREVMVQHGESILRNGDIVNERTFMILQDLGMLDTGADWELIGAICGALFCLYVLLVAILRLFAPEILTAANKLAVIGLLIVFTLAVGRTVMLITPEALVLIPVPAAVLIIAVLFDIPLALSVGVIISLISCFLMLSDIICLHLFLVGSIAALFGSRNLHQRTDLLVIGLRIGLAQAIVIFTQGALASQISVEMLPLAGMGLLSGLIAGFLALGLLPFFEGVFQLISGLKLLELGNPNHPLLRKLMMEAPGSYQHSIMVSNLAEMACDEIKANSLLARVGAFFHDIGKTKRPVYFVENQLQRENPHDQLRPLVSAAILFAHVKDGVELGMEHKLPEQILQFIRSHHGTSEAGYFYRRAVAEAKDGDVILNEDFRYPGPKPPNREVAVVMLADACEATVRTLDDPSEENITRTVQRICRERLNNGQLDDSDLTIRDLNRVMVTLAKALLSVYHRRIQYPQAVQPTNEDPGVVSEKKPT